MKANEIAEESSTLDSSGEVQRELSVSARHESRRGRLRSTWRALGPLGWISVALLALVLVAAVFAPWIAPHDPDAIDLSGANESPSASHLLGTDPTGRDLLSRFIFGAQLSLIGPLMVVLVAVSLGLLLSLWAAWKGGTVDMLVSRALDVLFGFPSLVLAIFSISIFGRSMTTTVLVLGIAAVPYVARVLRGAAIRERSLPYIVALEAQGLSGVTIARKHLIPSLLPLIRSQVGLGFGYALVNLAALSYVGLGIQPPKADWGVMVAEGQPGLLTGNYTESVVGVLLISMTVFAVNIVSERFAERRTAHV